MTIKVYVDWDGQEIISADEYEKKVKEEVSSLLNDEDEFNEWLSNHYMPQEIWHMTKAVRFEVMSLWEEYCRDYAEDQSEYCITHIEI